MHKVDDDLEAVASAVLSAAARELTSDHTPAVGVRSAASVRALRLRLEELIPPLRPTVEAMVAYEQGLDQLGILEDQGIRGPLLHEQRRVVEQAEGDLRNARRKWKIRPEFWTLYVHLCQEEARLAQSRGSDEAPTGAAARRAAVALV